MTVEDGERGSSSEVRWKTNVCNRKCSVALPGSIVKFVVQHYNFWNLE